MRKALWAILFVATLLTALPSRAQNPNYDVGPVWRVTYFHLKPGQGEAFWKDFRENLKPVYDAVKKEGMVELHAQLHCLAKTRVRLSTSVTRAQSREASLRGRGEITSTSTRLYPLTV